MSMGNVVADVLFKRSLVFLAEPVANMSVGALLWVMKCSLLLIASATAVYYRGKKPNLVPARESTAPRQTV